MREAIVPIEEVCSIYGREYPLISRRRIVDILTTSGWEEIDPIPTAEIPPEKRTSRIKYVYFDGNNRYGSAKKAKRKEVKVLIFGQEDNLNDVSRKSGKAILPSYETHISYALGTLI